MTSYFPINVRVAHTNGHPVMKTVYNQEQLNAHNRQIAVIDAVNSSKPYLYFSETSHVRHLR